MQSRPLQLAVFRISCSCPEIPPCAVVNTDHLGSNHRFHPDHVQGKGGSYDGDLCGCRPVHGSGQEEPHPTRKPGDQGLQRDHDRARQVPAKNARHVHEAKIVEDIKVENNFTNQQPNGKVSIPQQPLLDRIIYSVVLIRTLVLDCPTRY
mmetsp:Transcript_3952/g.7201  ORF Transcript_3952/g.7201 Transcript_3952/m.7201 type:complete len:150 (-) Transcript_3952:1981-2430(-)